VGVLNRYHTAQADAVHNHGPTSPPRRLTPQQAAEDNGTKRSTRLRATPTRKAPPARGAHREGTPTTTTATSRRPQKFHTTPPAPRPAPPLDRPSLRIFTIHTPWPRARPSGRAPRLRSARPGGGTDVQHGRPPTLQRTRSPPPPPPHCLAPYNPPHRHTRLARTFKHRCAL
jgi:hypothetical protein